MSVPPSDAEPGPATLAAEPLTREELTRLPAGASSGAALVKATGGNIEQIGKIGTQNALVLIVGERRFLYLRPQALGEGRSTAYQAGRLKAILDRDGRYAGCDLDHVASTGVEGKRMGMGYVLAAFVEKPANRSHGSTNEKGPAPVREAAKAFQGGIDRHGRDHVTYLTQEMVDKLAGNNSTGRGHSTFRGNPSEAELRDISRALMQGGAQQRHLRALTGGRSVTPATTGPVRR